MEEKGSVSLAIKAEASRLGFSACGIAPVHPVGDKHAKKLKEWIRNGRHAQMDYMERNTDKRCNPSFLVENAQSIICVALNYYPLQRLQTHQLQFAYYAYGKDYHEVMKKKLSLLYNYINDNLLPINGRIFCDTAPVLERYWAQQAGLGWVGKHTQLIIPHAGSYFFLGEILIDAVIDSYDKPMDKGYCGTCTRCLDACPANALQTSYTLDCNRCLSYLTIENKGEIPSESKPILGNRIYGCDECQKACPWNRFATPCTTPELQPSADFLNMQREDWKQLTIEQYRRLFKGSAVKRAKYEGLIRNINAIEE